MSGARVFVGDKDVTDECEFSAPAVGPASFKLPALSGGESFSISYTYDEYGVDPWPFGTIIHYKWPAARSMRAMVVSMSGDRGTLTRLNGGGIDYAPGVEAFSRSDWELAEPLRVPWPLNLRDD